jgi:ubiquinone/menaquinone biosynthesis C-methylase UbiE
LAGDENLAGRIDFRVGDTQSLDLGADEFDAVVAHTLISHVERPAAVLAEIARVAKPGGSIGIFDGDYASLTFGHPDPEQGKRDDDALIAAIVTNPRVMRQMPVLVRDAGLELVASFPYILAEVGAADFWRPAIESFRKLMPTAGAMTSPRADEWAERLLQASEAGLFFGASNYYGYVLRKPARA